jgi:hypothetical protein
MSTLQELVRGRASDELDTSIQGPGPSLRVITSDGEFWAIPWAHLMYVKAIKLGHCDVMSVVFVSHEIAIFGQQLTALAEEISEHRSRELRTSKEKYQTVSRIKTIEILARESPQPEI